MWTEPGGEEGPESCDADEKGGGGGVEGQKCGEVVDRDENSDGADSQGEGRRAAEHGV